MNTRGALIMCRVQLTQVDEASLSTRGVASLITGH